jgi:hypothetical protein
MSLSTQFASLAAVLSLVTMLTLTLLALQSSRHTAFQLQSDFGRSVAQQVAVRVAANMVAGDRLGMAAELQTLVAATRITGARITDIEGEIVAEAGHLRQPELIFSAPIVFGKDKAGTVSVAVDSTEQAAAEGRFFMGLLGIAVVLSIAVFAIANAVGQKLTAKLSDMILRLRAIGASRSQFANEITMLNSQLHALPLELLKIEELGPSQDDQYEEVILLYVNLFSLARYVDTVDQQRLQRYIRKLHGLIYGSANFYGGDIDVTRQFGATLFFHGMHKSGRAELRALRCAWLLQHMAAIAAKELGLTMRLDMAIGHSDLGRGDKNDMYPALYTQHAIDELLTLSGESEGKILLTPTLAERDIVKNSSVIAPHKRQLCITGLDKAGQSLVDYQGTLLTNALFPQHRDTQARQTPGQATSP